MNENNGALDQGFLISTKSTCTGPGIFYAETKVHGNPLRNEVWTADKTPIHLQ